MADNRRRPRPASSRVHGPGGEDAAVEPTGPDQIARPAPESIGGSIAEPIAGSIAGETDDDVRDSPPAPGAPREEIDPHTQQQDTTMDASTTMQTSQQTYDTILGTSREQVEKANQAMLKTAEEMQKLSKENLEACIQASTIIAKGMQELGREWTAYVQESLERSAAAAKALMAARTMQEVVALQSDWVKSSLDKLVAEAAKISEQTVKVTSDAMEPISARISVAAEKLKLPLAA